METMTFDPNMMMWIFVGMFIVSIIAMILAMFMAKKAKKLERGDIIRKILKERTKSLKLSGIDGIKDVIVTGGSKEIKRRPGASWGKYIGSIEWEFITEILTRRWGKKYYLLVPNEYISDPNRDHYVIRARTFSFHTWAWIPVVEDKKEQERIFDLADQWLDHLIKTAMRFENKESEFRASLEASSAVMARIPYRIVARKEEVEADEE